MSNMYVGALVYAKEKSSCEEFMKPGFSFLRVTLFSFSVLWCTSQEYHGQRDLFKPKTVALITLIHIIHVFILSSFPERPFPTNRELFLLMKMWKLSVSFQWCLPSYSSASGDNYGFDFLAPASVSLCCPWTHLTTFSIPSLKLGKAPGVDILVFVN